MCTKLLRHIFQNVRTIAFLDTTRDILKYPQVFDMDLWWKLSNYNYYNALNADTGHGKFIRHIANHSQNSTKLSENEGILLWTIENIRSLKSIYLWRFFFSFYENKVFHPISAGASWERVGKIWDILCQIFRLALRL